MRKTALTALVCMIAVWSADAYAQVHSLELIPFGGYRWGGSLSSIPGVRKFDTQDTWTYGVAIDAEMAYDSAAEIYYGHFSGDWDATLISGDKRTGSLNRDDIMLNGIWYAKGGRPAVRPYLTAGLGVSIYSADQISTTGRFAWNFGAGLRHDVSDKVGIRIDGRWIPTWFTTGSSVWCDPFYGCYPTSTGEFFDQFELSGGLMVKLGGN